MFFLKKIFGKAKTIVASEPQMKGEDKPAKVDALMQEYPLEASAQKLTIKELNEVLAT